MAQIKQILQIESERSEENRNVVHLFQEGTFYRAYNWSAWLCHRFVQQFKVTHKQLKGIEDSVLFIGFPVTSLEKYFGVFLLPKQASHVILQCAYLCEQGLNDGIHL